jgi:hypothetical protein
VATPAAMAILSRMPRVRSPLLRPAARCLGLVRLRSKVDSAKTNLYSLNASAADPLATASQAQSQAGAIVSLQSYPTLNDVFAGALAPFATAARTYAQRRPEGIDQPAVAGGNSSNRGSAIFSNSM